MLALLVGWASAQHRPPAANRDPAPAESPWPRPIELPGVENAFQLSEQIVSGGSPEGEASFQALARQGVKLVISVDGAQPDVEKAHAAGLKYVHLPIGYDGCDRATMLRLVRAASTAPGKVFVHCHHGRHRGPAAAALICRATTAWDRAQALAWLGTARTSTDYTGLYAAVAEFVAPTAEELAQVPAELPETSPVPPLVEAMVKIDKHWSAVGAALAPLNKPDLPAAGRAQALSAARDAAVLLRESLRELGRSSSVAPRDEDFRRLLTASEDSAAELQHKLGSSPSAAELASATSKTLLGPVETQCQACHRAHRDH